MTDQIKIEDIKNINKYTEISTTPEQLAKSYDRIARPELSDMSYQQNEGNENSKRNQG